MTECVCRQRHLMRHTHTHTQRHDNRHYDVQQEQKYSNFSSFIFQMTFTYNGDWRSFDTYTLQHPAYRLGQTYPNENTMAKFRCHASPHQIKLMTKIQQSTPTHTHDTQFYLSLCRWHGCRSKINDGIDDEEEEEDGGCGGGGERTKNDKIPNDRRKSTTDQFYLHKTRGRQTDSQTP